MEKKKKKHFKIILLELLDTELSSWIRKRIQKIELDSQEVSHEELFKTRVTRGH